MLSLIQMILMEQMKFHSVHGNVFMITHLLSSANILSYKWLVGKITAPNSSLILLVALNSRTTLLLLLNNLLIASKELCRPLYPPTSLLNLTLNGHYITVSWIQSALKVSRFIQDSKICAVTWMPMAIFCIYICSLHRSSLLSVALWPFCHMRLVSFPRTRFSI
jgi:hypothetical protein